MLFIFYSFTNRAAAKFISFFVIKKKARLLCGSQSENKFISVPLGIGCVFVVLYMRSVNADFVSSAVMVINLELWICCKNPQIKGFND